MTKIPIKNEAPKDSFSLKEKACFKMKGYSWTTEKFSKNWVRAIFFLENGQIDFGTCKYDTDSKIKRKDRSYFISNEKNKMFHDKQIPYLFYFEKYADPIEFKSINSKIFANVPTSDSLDNFAESKLIKEILSAGTGEKLILILLGAILILGILNFASSSGLFTHAVNATANMTNSTVIVR